MDPVQKAVLKHTFGGRGGFGGGAKARRSTQPVKCGVCQIKFNSHVSEATPPLCCREKPGVVLDAACARSRRQRRTTEAAVTPKS